MLNRKIGNSKQARDAARPTNSRPLISILCSLSPDELKRAYENIVRRLGTGLSHLNWLREDVPSRQIGCREEDVTTRMDGHAHDEFKVSLRSVHCRKKRRI